MGTSEVSNQQPPPWSAGHQGNGMDETKQPQLAWNRDDGKKQQNQPTMQGNSVDGILVPSFLQPLLGLDFVPYMPDGKEDSKPTSSESKHHISDDELKDLDLLAASTSSPDRISAGEDDSFSDTPNSSTSPAFSTPALSEQTETETLVSVLDGATTDKGEVSPVNTSQTSSKRERRGLKNRITSLVKGKHGRRRAHSSPGVFRKGHKKRSKSPLPPRSAGPPRKLSSGDSISLSWHDSVDGGEEEEVEPRRKIEFASEGGDSLKWIQEQRREVHDHVSHLNNVQLEARRIQGRTVQIYKRIGQVQAELSYLHRALQQAEYRLKRELTDFETAKSDLERLEASAVQASEKVIASIGQIQPSTDPLSAEIETLTAPVVTDVAFDNGLASPSTHSAPNLKSERNLLGLQDGEIRVTPLRKRASTAPDSFTTSKSESYMRVHDLDLENPRTEHPKDENSSFSSSNTSSPNVTSTGFVYVDHNVTTIIQNLSKLGYKVATDESDRFKPTNDTKKLLAQYKSKGFEDDGTALGNWPIQPWHTAHGNDILVWIGSVSHNGFGCNLPVCKGRLLMQISARGLFDYLLDSSNVKEYNKISLGRDDVYVLQDGVDTTAEDSAFGFAGMCKIVKTVNKPKLLPKSIETTSLMYATSLENAPGSYIIVNRSVFEDDSGEHTSKAKNTIRTEMLLGVTMIRPVEESVCELTSINHMYMPGVPEFAVKRAAPSQAYGMLKDLQNVFTKKR